MATINCLCQIRSNNVRENNINSSWLIVERKRLTHRNTCFPREDTIKVYAPVLIGICKAYFQSEINEMKENQCDNTNQVYENETATIDMYDSGRYTKTNKKSRCSNLNIVPSYHGMEHEKKFGEIRVASCGPWIVWNNKTKQFNRPVDFNGYWILKFPKDYWDGI